MLRRSWCFWRRLAAGAVALGGLAGAAPAGAAVPAAVAPLQANRAPFPAPRTDDATPEALAFAAGNAKDYAWVHARGFVRAPIAKVCAALRTAEVCRDPKIDSFSVSRGAADAQGGGFTLHYVAHRLLTIEFDVAWRFGTDAGPDGMATACAARFRKTAGTSFIRLLAGSVLLRSRDAQTTEVELIEHLDAARSGTDAIKSYFHDFYRQLLAAAHR